MTIVPNTGRTYTYLDARVSAAHTRNIPLVTDQQHYVYKRVITTGYGSNRIALGRPRSTDISALTCLDDLY